MFFSYNNSPLGVAYKNFDPSPSGLRPGFSTHLQQEIRFNFGDKPFRYPPPPEFLPINLSLHL